jgi:nitroimidazol reductase NimA-like FMN-containing flavoprotein (pyridoxamine 5'-phosphate oxidase superfamily)
MRPIRRKDREIDRADAGHLLTKGEYGILSTVGEDGQPYGVPLSYVYRNDGIYIHCARVGHKLDNIESNPKVSFCVVGDTTVLPSEFRTTYESVVAFGIATEVEGIERLNALLWLVDKYSPGFAKEGEAFVEQEKQAVRVIKIEVAHMSGKRARSKE